MNCAVRTVLQAGLEVPWQSCVEGAGLGPRAAPCLVRSVLIELGECLPRTGLCRSGPCHSSNAVPGARTSLGQSCSHRAAEFPLLLEQAGRDAVCWSSGVERARALHACIPAKRTLAAALGKAETRFLYHLLLTSLCSLQCECFTFLKHNRYLLLFKPLSTWNREDIFLCSQTCLVELIGERESSTALRASIRQGEGRGSVKGTGCLTKSEGLFLSCSLGNDYSLL